MSSEEIEDARSKIIAIMGTNSLGALVVLFTVSFVCFILFNVVLRLFCTFRVNKDIEIAGMDAIYYA